MDCLLYTDFNKLIFQLVAFPTAHTWRIANEAVGPGGELFSITASLFLFPLFISFRITSVTRR